MSSTPYWSQEKLINLSKRLEQLPCLWDTTSPEIKNRALKAHTMESLAREYGVDVYSIDKKLKCLRTQFRREHKKVSKLKEQGFSKRSSTWFGYEPLIFLSKCFNNPKVVGEDSEDYPVEEFSDNEDSLGTIEFKSEPDFETSKVVTSTSNRTKHYEDNAEEFETSQTIRSKHYEDNCKDFETNKTASLPTKRKFYESNCEDLETYKSIASVPAKRKNYEEDFSEDSCNVTKGFMAGNRDEHAVYGEHIANKLRNCCKNRYEISIAQHKINNVLFELEMGVYNKRPFSQWHNESLSATSSQTNPLNASSPPSTEFVSI